MDKLKEFNINFVGLADGLHEWTHNLNDNFLAQFETSLVKKAKVEVKVKLVKMTNLLTFDFDMSGTIETDCDICTEMFDLCITNQDTLLVKMVGETIISEEPDVMYLEFGCSYVHIAQYLYEMLMLAIPMRKIHLADKNGKPSCNTEILKFLANQNQENTVDEPDNSPNSVWDALKGIKNKK
jgi:uncharacterized protein